MSKKNNTPSAAPLHGVPQADLVWQRPTSATQGDSDPNPIYHCVGRIASDWEQIEGAFENLFSMLMASPGPAAGRVYGVIGGVPNRIEALKAAADVVWLTRDVPASDGLRVALDTLLAHYRHASGRRNEVIHAQVANLATESAEHGIFLIPPSYATRKTELPWVALAKREGLEALSPYRYVLRDLEYFLARFTELRRWVLEYQTAYLRRFPVL